MTWKLQALGGQHHDETHLEVERELRDELYAVLAKPQYATLYSSLLTDNFSCDPLHDDSTWAQ